MAREKSDMMRRIIDAAHTWWREIFSLVGALFIVWPWLGPGYVLTLDLVWTSNVPLVWNVDAPNNGFPVFAMLHYLTYVIPAWAVEKLLFFGIFFALFYIPLRFLPLIRDERARVFAAMLYALNPYVYSRMLAGQWLVLAGYALLPFLLHSLNAFTQKRNGYSAITLSAALLAVGLFSIHLVYLSCVVTALWIIAAGIADMSTHRFGALVNLLQKSAYMLIVFLIASSYWIAPALLRHSPIEARFDNSHFATFAASSNGNVPVMLNVAALGGYWGEGTAWNYYFRWPQSEAMFWLATTVIGFLILVGLRAALSTATTRRAGIVLSAVAALAYITALGAATTPFHDFNMWLYTHMPQWRGLRDSHKIAAFLALAHACFAGLGIERLLASLAPSKYLRYSIYVFLFAAFATFGMYEWNGFHGQLESVEYPSAWQDAKIIIDAAPPDEKVLVLPWHGYLSLDFDHQLLVGNPASTYFGSNRVIMGRSVEAGDVHDQEIDLDYAALDKLLGTSTPPDAVVLARELSKLHIRYIMVIMNTLPIDARNWTDMASQGPLESTLETIATQIFDGKVRLLKLKQ